MDKNEPLFWAPPELIDDRRVQFPPDEAHHLRDVIRLKDGDRLRVFDGHGSLYECRLQRAAKQIEAEILSVHRTTRALTEVVLAAGELKGERFDWIVEKATELGVARITPLRTVRTQNTGAGNRKARWQRLAVAACKQSANPFIPDITDPIPFDDFVHNRSEPNRWFFVERGGQLPPETGAVRSGAAAVMVGPEGGWEVSEVQAARKAGFDAITLNDVTLRAETGAVVALALVRSWLDWRR